MKYQRCIRSVVLPSMVFLLGIGLAAWKYDAIQAGQEASANQPEPMETVTVALAKEIEHRQTTTSIGTVLALRSITLRNELAGTVREVRLTPGQIVQTGTVLVALDVSVEEAELKAEEAQAALAKTVLDRRRNLNHEMATTQEEIDRAKADLDVARAQIARTKALIGRKRILAPFRSRVGMADVHPGQYLNEGTLLTTLQGIDDAVHVDFSVAQQVAVGLHEGEQVEVFTGASAPVSATIIALDARIDPATRNAVVRARIDGAANAPAPGSSVRVRVPVGDSRKAIAIPVSALRKGPGGDQVFVIAQDKEGHSRARIQQVESGAMFGDEVVIHTGLSAGDHVAASGSFKLREAALVSIAGDNIGETEQRQAVTLH
jgi:membrane fusion protein (multidrug efflux system)